MRTKILEVRDIVDWSDNEDPPTAPSVEEEKEEVNILPAEEVTDAFETLRAVVPVSTKKFFDLFFSENAEYSILDYCKDRGDTEIETTPWAQNEELSAYSRELKYRTKINGPSIGPKTTRCHRVQLYSMTDNKLTIKTSTKALDVPYSSYFVVEDEWNITEMSPDKSLLRCTVAVNMLKSTMFRSKIESRTKSDVTKDMEQWFKEAKKRCLGDQPTPPPVEKPAEKQIHQIAKYEEVDLRTFQKKSQIKSGIQATAKNILIANTVLVLLLFFYLRYLHTRLNELSFPVTSEV
jgi:hypothetical protein